MKNLVTESIIIIGTIFTLLYVIGCKKAHKRVNITFIINEYLISGGMVSGVLLFLSPWVPGAREALTDFELYVAISGVAVFVVSLNGLVSNNTFYIFNRNRTSNENEKHNSGADEVAASQQNFQ